MFIALTGTPGTGKTSIANALKQKDFTVISAQEIAKDNNCIIDYDAARTSDIIDIARLQTAIKDMVKPIDSPIIIEGHISHVLSLIEKVIVLRCHPDILQKRLQKKGWKQQKIKENIASELLGVILSESIDYQGILNVFEINGSEQSITSIASEIENLILSSFQLDKKYQPGHVDWMPLLLNESYAWMVQDDGS